MEAQAATRAARQQQVRILRDVGRLATLPLVGDRAAREKVVDFAGQIEASGILSDTDKGRARAALAAYEATWQNTEAGPWSTMWGQ